MEFKNLTGLTIEELTKIFNHSFSDYVIPFRLTEEQLRSKIDAEKIDMELSVGAFHGGQLVGFILQVEKSEEGRRMIYNAGTGIAPEYRGQGLVRKMYDYIGPVVKEKQADVLILEVIESNVSAIRAYNNLGFSISRKLLCFKGNVPGTGGISDVQVRQMEGYQWEEFQSFWDIKPAWQSAVMALEQMRRDCMILGAYEKDKLTGYAVFNAESGKIYQIAVKKDHRRRGVGTILIGKIAQMNEKQTIVVNNVDSASDDTCRFFLSAGLENWISQFEMTRGISAS